jgi:exodeoxyribonuclease VII large subunit
MMSKYRFLRGMGNLTEDPRESSQDSSAEARPYTVSELTSKIRGALQSTFPEVWVEGEVTNFRQADSGHCYFSLKDEKALIACVIWASVVRRIGTIPSNGSSVEVEGTLDVYEPRGIYQINVQSIRPAGLGRLYQAFLRLKEKLAAEGLFDASRKRPIPPYPRTVGVITSPAGAVIRDILKVLGQRAPHVNVLLYPVRVQGEGAADEICHAIKRMNEIEKADVLIVGRGGGSLEDLWAFNEERVARAIAASQIPVISAVGHETDFTIADFVADLRAATPSHAAELVARRAADLVETLVVSERRMLQAVRSRLPRVRELEHLRSRLIAALEQKIPSVEELKHLRSRILTALRKRIETFKKTPLLVRILSKEVRSRVEEYKGALVRHRKTLQKIPPLLHVNRLRQQIDDLQERATRRIKQIVAAEKHRLELLEGQLLALDPKAILARGYSITYDMRDQRIIRSSHGIPIGCPLKIVLHEGELAAQVTKAGLCRLPNENKNDCRELPLFSEDNAETNG